MRLGEACQSPHMGDFHHQMLASAYGKPALGKTLSMSSHQSVQCNFQSIFYIPLFTIQAVRFIDSIAYTLEATLHQMQYNDCNAQTAKSTAKLYINALVITQS